LHFFLSFLLRFVACTSAVFRAGRLRIITRYFAGC